VPVTWQSSVVDTNSTGTYTFKGSVSGYEKAVVLNLEVVQRGNTLGNIANYGYIAESNGWLYFSDRANSGLYKVKKDGSDKVKLFDQYASNINIAGDYIYFSDRESHLNKIKVDGTGLTKLSDDMTKSVTIIGNTIYYNSSNSFNKMKIDGTSIVQIVNHYVNFATISNGWIYYIDMPNGETNLKKVKTDGTNDTFIMNVKGFNSFIVYDDWIYYSKDALFRVKTDGSDNQLVNSKEAYNLNMVNDWLIYKHNSGDGIYKLKYNTNNEIKISVNKPYEITGVLDNYIYYYSIENDIKVMRRVKIDGTEDKIFHIPEAQ
jgi:hypothetical protein